MKTLRELLFCIEGVFVGIAVDEWFTFGNEGVHLYRITTALLLAVACFAIAYSRSTSTTADRQKPPA